MESEKNMQTIKRDKVKFVQLQFTDLYGIVIGDNNGYLQYDPVNGLRIKGNVLHDIIEELDDPPVPFNLFGVHG